jgi:hypothetical protein
MDFKITFKEFIISLGNPSHTKLIKYKKGSRLAAIALKYLTY